MKKPYNKKYHFISLTVISLMFTGTPHSVIAADYYPPGLFNIAGKQSQLTNEELDVFKDNDIAPGQYKINILINKIKIANQEVDFILMKNSTGNEKLTPCFSKTDWENFGVEFPASIIEDDSTNNCFNINNIEFVQGNLDLNTKNYSIKVPQSYINKDKLARLEEENWDNGIPVIFVNYLFSAFNRQSNGESNDDYYGNIQTRVNIGAWRYKNYSTWTNDRDGKKKWNNLSNTLSRNINQIKSEFVIGSLYSSSKLFDSVKYQGIRLSTDRTMDPSNRTNYVPTISGLANSEAVVTVTQNDEIILKQSVPAGPFNLTNYFPMNNGGNLYVNVKETDGSEKNFIIPFSSISTLERKGNVRYSLSSGKYDSHNDSDGKYINQADVFYGFTDFITLYGGVFIAQSYQSAGIGTAFNLGVFGAVTADVLHAKTTLTDDKKFSGNAFRVNYSKKIEATNTSLSLVGYRHFDTDFYRFDDAMSYNENNNNHYKLKNEYTLSLNQPILSGNSSLNISTVIHEYTNGKKQKSYNTGFNSSFNKISYGVYYNYYQGGRSLDNNKNTYNVSLNLSVPFTLNDYPVWANYNASMDNNRQTSQTVGLSGNYGEKQQGSWDIYQSHGNKGIDYSGGLSSAYRSQYSTVHAGYSYSKDNKNLSYGMSGSLIATQYGVLATPSLQETNALVLTKDTAGIGVMNGQSLKTNNSGLAILSGVTPYRKNNIAIDTRTLPGNIEIENNIINNIIPTKGALVLADFETKKGYKLLIKLISYDNNEIPLGAKAGMEENSDYLVSNFNSLYFVANKEKGDIQIKWTHNGIAEKCHVNYDVASIIPTNGLYIMTLTCQKDVL